MLKEFPAFSEEEKADSRMPVEISAKSLEREFVQTLEKVKSQKQGMLRSWLTDVNEKHRNWLARLR